MKIFTNIKALIVFVSVVSSFNLATAQITNGGINYELRVDQFYQAFDNDGLSNDDHQWRIGINSDGNTGGSTTWVTGSPCGANNYGYQWSADAPSNSSANLNILLYTGINRSGASTFNIAGESWEEDGGWDCSGSGDAGTWIGNYNVSFNTAIKTPALWWGPDDVANGEWVNEDWAVTSGSRNGDARIKTAWRYTYGYDCNNGLDFGTLTIGAAAKTHLNTNRGIPSGGSINVGYANVTGNTAPDVYYTFTLATDATVVISTVSATTNYNSFLRLYNSDCSTQITSNDDFSGTQAQITQYLCAGTYKILVEGNGASVGDFLLSVSANATTPAVPSTPAALTFGTNQWYVYGYDGGTLNITGTYKGYYTETALSYNTTSKWNINQSASYAPGWNGNCVNIDNHVVVSKRQGFPCAVYQLDVPSHDDDQRVYINGVLAWSHEPGCCDAHTNIWTGYLTSTSTIEVRHIDGAGGSNQALNFTVVTPSLNGGTIAGISNGVNVCQGTDPGAFTSSANASGGTIGVTNGSPAAHTYLWQRATDAAFTVGLTTVGTNSNTYDPDNSLTGGTYYFRRRVTDACGTVAYSNTIQINIIHNITATPPTANAATGGSCTQWRANWNAVTGATSYRLDVATDAGFTSMVAGFNDLNVGNVTFFDLNLPLGTYYYRVRAVNSCFTSSNSNTISFTLSNVANNDLYKNAIDISANIAGGGAYSGSFNNSSYGTESGEQTPNGVYSTAWYKFTTPAGGFTSISAYQAENGNDNTAIAIYRSNGGTCPFGNLTDVGNGYECISSNLTVTTNCLLGNTTYYVQYGTQDCFLDGGTRGGYNISITPGSVASPDDICNAITLGGATLDPGEAVNNTVVNNTCASRQSGEPHSDVFNTVWYKFVTPAAGLESVDFHLGENGNGSDNPAIVAYRSTGGCTFGSLVQEVGSDIPGLGTDANSDFTVNCLQGGTTYYIQCGYNDRPLDGGTAGVFDLDISASSYATGPDNVCSATSIGTMPNATTGGLTLNNQSNICAGTQANEPGGGQATVWYTFTTAATVGKNYAFNMDATSGGLNADIYVYRTCGTVCTGSTLNSNVLEEIGNWYDANPLPGEYDAGGTISGIIRPNTTYYIRADGTSTVGETGTFNLSISQSGGAPLANDNISCATVLGSGGTLDICEQITGSGNNIGSSDEDICGVDEPQEDNNRTVWYKFTAGASIGTNLKILVTNAGGDNMTPDIALFKQVVGPGTCGSLYSFGGNLQFLAESSGVYLVDNDAEINISSCSGAYVAGATYFLQIDDEGGGALGYNEGNFNFTIIDNGKKEGANDICSAVDLASAPPATSGSCSYGSNGNADATLGLGETLSRNNQSNYCANTQAGEPELGSVVCVDQVSSTVWYKFTTAATAAPITVRVTDDGESGNTDDIDPYISVYKSCSGCTFGSNLVQVGEAGGTDVLGGGESDDYSFVFNPSPSTTYYVQVAGWVDGLVCGNSEKGDFNVSVAMSGTVIPGDYICSAILAGSTGWSESGVQDDKLGLGETIASTSNFTNKNTTVEDGCGIDEPDNNSSDETVWFKFQTGATPGTEIAVNVDAISGSGTGGACVLGGTTFAWLKVWEWAGANPGGPLCTDATRFLPANLIDIGRADLLDNSKEYIDCPKPNTWYFAQVELGFGSTCDMADFSATIVDNGIARAPNDKICDATVMGLPTYAAPSTLIGTYIKHYLQNQNNFCAGAVEDPAACWTANPENDKTVWYRLPGVADPGLADISHNGRQVVIVNAYSEHAAGDEDEINLQLALYSVASLSCPANTATYTISSDKQGANCAYVGPASLDLDQLFQYSEYLTAACLTPATDYYLQVDGNDLDLVLDEVLREGWFELEAYYPREIGDLPCDAVGFKTWGIQPPNGGPYPTGSDELLNNSNLCTSYTPGVGANQEPPVTFTTGDGNDNPGWVYFYAPASGSVKITATADPNDIMKDGVFDNIDLQLAIFQETVIDTCNTVQPPQSPVSSITSYNILDGYGEEMYVNCLTPGRKYYIMVDGSASPLTQTRGIFDLKIEDFAANSYAPNDEMQDAIAFTNTYTATSTWNRINNKVTESILDTKNWCADNLNEPGRPVLGGYNETGVWYKFIAPPSGMVHFLAENTDYASLSKPSGDPNHIDLSLAVYQLNAGYTASQYATPAATTLIAQDYQNPLVTSGIAALGTSAEDEEMIVECLTPGREYYLLVSGKKSSGIGSDWDYGRYNLYMTSHPRNPASWNGATAGQYLPSPLPASIDLVCNAADLGTMPAGTAWFQPFGDRQVPKNCASNYYQSPTFNNFCATATSDPIPGYQQNLVNVFGGNHKPVWFKFTTPATGAYDASRISVEVEVISGDCDAGILDDWYDNACTPSDEEYQDCLDAGVSVWLPSAIPTLCSTSLYEMDSDYDILNFDEQADIHCLDPNTEYYIMVDGSSLNQEGNFNVRVQQITPDPRPFNNYICNAKKLTTGSNTAVASFWGGGAAFTYAKDTNICADTRLTSVSASGTEPIPSGWDVVTRPSDAADMTNTVWYSFLTPAPAADYAVHIDINSDLPWPFGDLVNPKIAVWESQDGSCNYTHPNGTNMVEMASEYDPLAFWGESIDVYCLKPNKRYFVQVGGTTNVYGQDQGYFDIVINDITPIAIPVNDDVCSAVNLGTMSNAVNSKLGNASSGASNYHNYCTDLEAGEPVPAAFTPDNTVWFKFRTPNNAGKRFNVTINANSDPAPSKNDGINLQLALYESSVLGSCAFANFTELESDFDAILWDETLTATCLKPNTDYYIQVDGTKGLLELFRAQGFGYFGIEVVTTAYYDAPTNDNMCNATNLGTVPVAGQLAPATWYYNTCATLEVNEIDPVGDVIDYGIEKTVWFKFVPGRDADFKISAISDCLLGAGCDPVDLQVALFRPTSGLAPACPTYADMVQEAADYDPVFFDEDLTAPCLRAGQTYYIQVDGSALNGDGEFQIKVEDMGSSTVAPANDNFCAATLMTFTAGVASLTNQSNVCATIQASEPQTPANVQKSVWYKFQAPPSGRIRITTHDADGAFRGLDPEFYVYENGASFNCASFANLTANGSDYNAIPDVPIICPNCGDEEVENECFVPGWWYLIQVDGTTVGGPQGKFDIKIEDLLTPYTVISGNKPANDDFASATTLTIQTEPCNEGGGRTELVGTGTWDPENYGKSTRDMVNGLGSGACSVSELCGDLWYKFVVTSPACNNGYSPMIIQGKGKSTLLEGSELHVIAYKGTAGALTPLGCGTAGSTLGNNSYFNFEINEAVGTTVYLQVFGENADDWDENFELCVSQKRGFDYCSHAAASPPMTYGVDYCYNIKGATLEPAANGYAESCPLTGIPGLPDPDSDAPTENSVYFKFVTDNTCSDYRLNFKYYFTGYSALSDKGISYTIYKDDTPCDGVALGSGALDCQSFYNNNAGSFEYDILFRNNSYLATATGIDNNSTYYIQIDGPGNNFGNLDGTLRITQEPICLPITIETTIPTETLTTYYTCGDGWRHYYNLVGGVRKYKWSLYDNGNSSLQGNVTLTYNTGANFYSATNGCIEASWVMRRYWNYNVTAGSIAGGSPVRIRFYYLPSEKQAIIDQMDLFSNTGCAGLDEGFEWFKSHDGVAFNPAVHIDPEYVIARYGSGASTNAAQSLTVLDNQTSCTVPASGVNPAIPGVRYVEYQNLLSFSGGTGATGNGDDDSPLPIELVSFTGYHNADNYTNNLNWVTAAEINSSRFVVEKSLDGSSFTYLGEKAGAGNSTTTLNYDLVDTKPSLGDNYYRLKMIDKDGTFEYSRIINVNVGVGDAGSQILGIYPNPTRGMLNIRFLSGEKENFTMRVMNTTGQVVRENTFDFAAGINFIEMNTFDFADGLYILQFVGENGGRFDGKFVKE